MRKIIYLCFVFVLFMSCSSVKNADIVYGKSVHGEELKLNIFVPNHAENKKLPVLIFVHGGNWNSGSKDQYGFFGRNFAKKDVVTVIPDYTLSPKATADEMTAEISQAIKWVQKNIASYHGDNKKLFLTGHSAGGHLVASAVLNPKFEVDESSISGIILNDAAGIDMKNYLEKYPPTTKDDYLATWTSDPKKWYEASPIYFIDKNAPPFLIYVGSKTYPSIKVANENFVKKLNDFQPSVKPIIINKGHIPMILQYFYPWTDRFDEINTFMKNH